MGLLPEHTSAAYSQAFYEGVDFVELDIQITKDLQLITSHDPVLVETSDILDHLDEFGDRKRNISFGTPYNYDFTDDYLIHDFTLEEIKSLRRVQRYKGRNHVFDKMFQYQTLNETIEQLLDLNAKNPNRKTGTFPVGLYIETKMYEFYRQNYGVNSADLVLDTLKAYGLGTAAEAQAKLPIILECFESQSLQHLKNKTDLPLIFLMKSTPAQDVLNNLKNITEWAHGIGPHDDVVVTHPVLPHIVHKHGLKMHPWYVRNDFLSYKQDVFEENKIYFDKHIDGIFTEFPEDTVSTYEYLVRQKREEDKPKEAAIE
eukprot:CAMPEP_0170494128 /NCGR_PEP_ID=MMETSP0208-20121228/14464_1 /TAXON_ID=197538 /ORGANISM="Strombidium inclinatum, Strain S3" /LENGTH=314 /DNA_ID=CAMNT_0010770137 /DNA_START=127 /DNA_END=1068 /DNA_ORIENTATION=+